MTSFCRQLFNYRRTAKPTVNEKYGRVVLVTIYFPRKTHAHTRQSSTPIIMSRLLQQRPVMLFYRGNSAQRLLKKSSTTTATAKDEDTVLTCLDCSSSEDEENSLTILPCPPPRGVRFAKRLVETIDATNTSDCDANNDDDSDDDPQWYTVKDYEQFQMDAALTTVRVFDADMASVSALFEAYAAHCESGSNSATQDIHDRLAAHAWDTNTLLGVEGWITNHSILRDTPSMYNRRERLYEEMEILQLDAAVTAKRMRKECRTISRASRLFAYHCAIVLADSLKE